MELPSLQVLIFSGLQTFVKIFGQHLSKQQGFQDEIAFVVPGGTEAVSISVGDQQAQAEAYHRGTYPAVLKALANVVQGTPQGHAYAVSNSTFHKIVAPVTV